MNNPDVVQLTEIKNYFLDPPISFKLGRYAIERIDAVLSILDKYNLRNDEAPMFLLLLKGQIEANQLTMHELRKELIEGGKRISNLNNQ